MMYGDWGWGSWLAGGLMMLAFWALAFWAIVSLVRRPTDSGSRTRSAEEILDERFARGEIDAADYEQRRRTLKER